MFRCRFTSERHPRAKNGQPAHKTTGVERKNCTQREPVLIVHSGVEGSRCPMARRKTGKVKTAPWHFETVDQILLGVPPEGRILR